MIIDKLLFAKFVKFCLIGFSGMFIDFGITWVLKEKVKLNKYIANSLGFIFAASSNYLWNRWWTFNSGNIHILAEYFSFILISVIGLGLNNFIIFILNEKIKFGFYFSKLNAVGAVTMWNFILNYLITFS